MIIREAKADAERIVEEGRAEIRRMEDQISALDRSRRAFLAQTRGLIERHLSELAAAEQSTGYNPSNSTDGRSSRENGAGSPAWMGSIAQE